jgi:hypothetical protein
MNSLSRWVIVGFLASAAAPAGAQASERRSAAVATATAAIGQTPDPRDSPGCEIEAEPIPLRAIELHGGQAAGRTHGTGLLRIRCGRATAYAVSFGCGAHYDNGRRSTDATTGAHHAYEPILDPGLSAPWDGEHPLLGVSEATKDVRVPIPAGRCRNVYVDIEF